MLVIEIWVFLDVVVTLIQLLILNGCPYLSGVWSGVDLRTDTTKACVFERRLDYELKIC